MTLRTRTNLVIYHCLLPDDTRAAVGSAIMVARFEYCISIAYDSCKNGLTRLEHIQKNFAELIVHRLMLYINTPSCLHDTLIRHKLLPCYALSTVISYCLSAH